MWRLSETQQRIAARRELVRTMRLQGARLRQIAQALGCGIGTVHRDWTAIRALWHEQQMRAGAELVAREHVWERRRRQLARWRERVRWPGT